MAAANLTDDAFLGGRINILQPKAGFRAGLDAVVLAAAVNARERQLVCDLGAGVGTVGLCLSARVPGLRITAVELDPGLARLAQLNFERNGLGGTVEVVEADVFQRPRSLPRQGFHHVVTNPPFYDTARGTVAPDGQKARAKSIDDGAFGQWVKFARALVRPKGMLTMIIPPARLAAALDAIDTSGAGVEIIPLWPRLGEPSKRMILRAQMNSRAPMILHAGLVLHDASGKSTRTAEEILREGKPLTT